MVGVVISIYLIGFVIYHSNRYKVKQRPKVTEKAKEPPEMSDLTICKFCQHPYKYDIHYYCPKCFRDSQGLFPKDNIQRFKDV